MDLGNKIKELRVQKLMSQEKIAEELGVSRQAVSKWETGLSNPDTTNLIALAKLFNISVDELAERKSGEESTCIRKKGNVSKSVMVICGMLGMFLVISGIVLALIFDSMKSTHIDTKSMETEVGTNPSAIISEDETVITDEEETAISDEDETIITEEGVDEVDYLNSQESMELQAVAQSFSKAYFSGDLEDVKLYLADIESAKVYEKNIYDNLQYMNLKWNPEDIATETTLEIQYQFQEQESDSANYLGLEMMKISDKWKVISFYLEK